MLVFALLLTAGFILLAIPFGIALHGVRVGFTWRVAPNVTRTVELQIGGRK